MWRWPTEYVRYFVSGMCFLSWYGNHVTIIWSRHKHMITSQSYDHVINIWSRHNLNFYPTSRIYEKCPSRMQWLPYSVCLNISEWKHNLGIHNSLIFYIVFSAVTWSYVYDVIIWLWRDHMFMTWSYDCDVIICLWW
jgi:hypothetical protein